LPQGRETSLLSTTEKREKERLYHRSGRRGKTRCGPFSSVSHLHRYHKGEGEDRYPTMCCQDEALLAHSLVIRKKEEGILFNYSRREKGSPRREKEEKERRGSYSFLLWQRKSRSLRVSSLRDERGKRGGKLFLFAFTRTFRKGKSRKKSLGQSNPRLRL